MAEGFEEAVVVEPPDPLQGGEFDVLQAPPWALSANDLGFEEADHALGQGVVVGIAPAADGRLDSRFGQSLGITNREVLNAPVAVVNKRAIRFGLPLADRLLQSVQGQVAPQGAGDPPAD
jgi:hypothetical protein